MLIFSLTFFANAKLKVTVKIKKKKITN